MDGNILLSHLKIMQSLDSVRAQNRNLCFIAQNYSSMTILKHFIDRWDMSCLDHDLDLN